MTIFLQLFLLQTAVGYSYATGQDIHQAVEQGKPLRFDVPPPRPNDDDFGK